MQSCIHVLILRPTASSDITALYSCTYIEAHRASSNITALYTCTYIEVNGASSNITALYTCTNIETHSKLRHYSPTLKPKELALTLEPCINVLTLKPTELARTLQSFRLIMAQWCTWSVAINESCRRFCSWFILTASCKSDIRLNINKFFFINPYSCKLA